MDRMTPPQHAPARRHHKGGANRDVSYDPSSWPGNGTSKKHFIHVLHFVGDMLTETNDLNCHFQEKGGEFQQHSLCGAYLSILFYQVLATNVAVLTTWLIKPNLLNILACYFVDSGLYQHCRLCLQRMVHKWPSLQIMVHISGRGDGNCMLRVVSCRLFGTEEHHLLTRLLTSLELIQHPQNYDTSHTKDMVCDARIYHDPYHRLNLSLSFSKQLWLYIHVSHSADTATVRIVLYYRIQFEADVPRAGLACQLDEKWQPYSAGKNTKIPERPQLRYWRPLLHGRLQPSRRYGQKEIF